MSLTGYQLNNAMNTIGQPATGLMSQIGSSGMMSNIGGPLMALGNWLGQDARWSREYHAQQEMAQNQYAYQRKLNQQGFDLNKRMWLETNFPQQVAQMKKAGLSPALMYGGGPGSGGTTGGQSGGSAQMGGTPGVQTMDMDNLLLGEQLNNLIADIKQKNSQAELNKDLGEKAISEKNAIDGYQKSESEARAEESRRRAEKIEAEKSNVDQNTKLQLQETLNAKQQYNLTRDQYAGLVMQEVQKGFQELNKVDNIEADTQLKKHQAWKLREDVRLMTHDLIIKNETNRIKNQANEVERLKAEITKYVNELSVDQKTKQMYIDNAVRVFGIVMSYLKPGGGGLEIINQIAQ